MRSSRRTDSGRLVASLEMMLYAFFFVVTLAIVGTLLGMSLHASREAALLERAVELASDSAARFAVDPTAKQEVVSDGGLRAICEVESQSEPFGHLYRGTVRVFDGTEVIYKLETARYLSARGGA